MVVAITIRQVEGKPGSVYYPLERIEIPSQDPSPTQVKVRISAVALNHRDLFIRQHLYPGTTFGVPLLADGVGEVIATGEQAKQWQGRRVVLNPGTGWKDDPIGPEDSTGYKIMGGTKVNALGTLCEELVIDATELEEAPSHLSDAEAAALPLTGLTAWRATFTKAEPFMKPGKNILVTGIGGGVALMALLYGVAAGTTVWVSSGSEEKLQRAKQLGAAGGVNYKEDGWPKKLLSLVGGKVDAIIDGSGGEIVAIGAKILKPGGIISVYGMTTGPKMPFVMSAVMQNIEIRGTTMGSRKEFADMVAFVNQKGLKPIVSRKINGLDIDALDGLFTDMKNGIQFGKLVAEIGKGESSRL